MLEFVAVILVSIYLIRLGNEMIRISREDTPQETARGRKSRKLYKFGRN